MSTDQHRRPAAFRLDRIRVTDDQDAAFRPSGIPVVVREPDDEPLPAPPPRIRRRMRWSDILISALGVLVSLGIGLAVSIMAAVLNGIVGRILIKVGTRHRSITLRADGKHLMADVYTSVGVVVGLGLAWLTGWNWLDPVIAILVGVNILVCRLPADVRIRLRPDGRDPVPRGQRPDPGHPGRARRTGPERIPRRAHARVRGPPVHGDAHAGARRLDGAARA